ncbi:hypothetical protein CHO01_40320 [Cellulomonas hominis]|uniref:Uncharacterized protein n=1 Tax=Cellulomonas hominis TaxID=156981 RepID=A0A511FI39_9CELL|nr:hypothetical protein [Cellulomonas hominis]MBB5473210.1 hypothetical protein [Cellulomonas hominis]NKY08027.1 hypothetical protein [Cellulomonas hominis]GEL48916.1 hypothetical protein CHO01_40320 [Cellulomonas hominis]
MIIAERDEIAILEGARVELSGAFQTIGALHQEVGDRFEAETGFRWDEGVQLLYAANSVLSGGTPSRVEHGPGLPHIAVFAISQSGWGESIQVGLTISAARLLLRSCIGALEHIDEPEFFTLTGAEVSEVRQVVELLDGLGLDE